MRHLNVATFRQNVGFSSVPPTLRRSAVTSHFRPREVYYRKNGQPTGEYDSIRHSLKPLRKLYGPIGLSEFGPLALKTIREAMIKSGLCRNEINKRIGRIVRMFKWGVESEFVAAMTHHALSQVRGLSRGRSPARESKPVKPVSDSHVEAIRPHASRRNWAMIELQRTTGMRPGEVCIIRSGDVDRSGAIMKRQGGRARCPSYKINSLSGGPACFKPGAAGPRNIVILHAAKVET